MLIAFFEMSSATNEVEILRRGMLNSFDIMLNIDMETPAEANSTGPTNTNYEFISNKRPNFGKGKDHDPHFCHRLLLLLHMLISRNIMTNP